MWYRGRDSRIFCYLYSSILFIEVFHNEESSVLFFKLSLKKNNINNDSNNENNNNNNNNNNNDNNHNHNHNLNHNHIHNHIHNNDNNFSFYTNILSRFLLQEN